MSDDLLLLNNDEDQDEETDFNRVPLESVDKEVPPNYADSYDEENYVYEDDELGKDEDVDSKYKYGDVDYSGIEDFAFHDHDDEEKIIEE